MAKYVCSVCGYVHEGIQLPRNVHSAEFLLISSQSRRQQ